jgi:hypothetical protein
MRDYVDARDDAVESRLNARLDKLATKGTIWAATGTALGLVLAAWAIAGGAFSSGLSVSPSIARLQNSQAAVDLEQNTKLESLDNKLDVIIRQTANSTR